MGDFLFVLPGTFDADAPESADEAEQSSEPEEEEEEDEDKENKARLHWVAFLSCVESPVMSLLFFVTLPAYHNRSVTSCDRLVEIYTDWHGTPKALMKRPSLFACTAA